MRHGQRKTDDWFPFFIDKWLFGSTRYELEPDEQSTWLDLLVLSKKDDGYIRANEMTPYPLPQLAGFFNKPVELIERTIKKLLDPKIAKLKEISPGIYYVPSQEAYELSERQKRRIRAAIGEANPPGRPPATHYLRNKPDNPSLIPDIKRTEGDEKNRIEENRIEENREDGAASSLKDSPNPLSEEQETAIARAAF